jgi:hypothetical protein
LSYPGRIRPALTSSLRRNSDAGTGIRGYGEVPAPAIHEMVKGFQRRRARRHNEVPARFL